MEFALLALVSSFVKKMIDFVKYLTNGDLNALLTQVLAWGAGVFAALLTAHSDWGTTFLVNGTPISNLNNWSLALIGFNLASAAGVGWDFIKAFDASNSAIVPNLLGATSAPQGRPGTTGPIRPVYPPDRVE